MHLRPTLLTLLVSPALCHCTDADVYTATGADPFRPDRIAITGRLCTEDTAGADFPVKILLMTDISNAIFTADPEFYRLHGPGSLPSPGSIEAFIDRIKNQENATVGFASISSVSRPIVPVLPLYCPETPCNAQQFFRPADVDLGLVQNGIGVGSGASRDLEAALGQVESFIVADMARTSAGKILRTRYLVYMLLGGPPSTGGRTAEVMANVLGDKIDQLKQLIYARGALEFRLNIGYVYFGPQSSQPIASGGYGCQTDPVPGSAPAPWSTWETWNREARNLYSAMAFKGDGLFREFPCGSAIDVRLESSAASVLLKRKDIVAYNLNVRLGRDGPVLDSDGDGLTDEEELAAPQPTRPDDWDTDGDGISDRVELRSYPQQDPLDPSDRPVSCGDGPLVLDLVEDADADLLNDCEEGLLQTNFSIPDSDGDGLPDALEFMSGTVPTSARDRLLDFDGDGISNADEVLEHTNPRTNDGRLRGAEGYRTSIVDLGVRTVATMRDPPELGYAVLFRSASPGVKGGAGLLRFTPGNPHILEWSDASINEPPAARYDPRPAEIDPNIPATYNLYAENAPTGDVISIEVFVIPSRFPNAVVEAHPHISTSDRTCYDIKMSNIRLMQTRPAHDILHWGPSHPDNEHPEGTNHILVFFTQAPGNRLDSPGIAKWAHVPVVFRCTDPEVIDSCAREPDGGFVELTDADLTASQP